MIGPEHEAMRRRVEDDTRAKCVESPPPKGYAWSLMYRNGERRPDEDRLVELDTQLGFPIPDEVEWRFGFGPKEAEFAWRCQRCRTIMLKNMRRCPSCLFTVFDPVHRITESKEMT